MKSSGPLAALLLALLACKKEDPPPPPAPAIATPAATPTSSPAPSPTVAPAPAAPDPVPDIPEGRSNPPTVAEWSNAAEVNTQGANAHAKDCFMKIVREWLKVNCQGKVREVAGMENFGKETQDYFQSVKPGKSADFVVRLKPGKVLKLRIRREDDTAVLFTNWPQGAPKPTIVALGHAPKE